MTTKSAPRDARDDEYECEICKDREWVFMQVDGRERKDCVVPCKCKQEKAIRRMLKASGLTPEQRAVKLEDFKPTGATMSMYRTVQRYLKEFPAIMASNDYNKGLALMGKVGTGKTMLMTAITNQLLDMRVPVIFIPTPDLIAELRVAQFSDGGQEMEEKIHQLAEAQVVIFDDLAKEKATDWVQTQYFRIVDARYRNRMVTLFTSNHNIDAIAERLSDAIASRLYALTKGRQVYVEAPDYRLK